MLLLQNSKILNKTIHSIPQKTKIWSAANQTEVPIEHYVTVTWNITIEDDSRQFAKPFAVADIKHNILGTPFSEEYKQNKNIQDFTLRLKHQSTVHPNYTNLTSLSSKDYPYFSFIYRINSKTQIRLKPNSSKIAHFPIRNNYCHSPLPAVIALNAITLKFAFMN